MATALPGMYGTVSQDAQLLAMKAGPAHPGHGTVADPTITRGVRGKDAAIYASPVPVAGALPSFQAGANPDRTPRTHAAPTTAWATMSAGDAQALASSYHAVKFVQPRHTQYVPPNLLGTDLINDVYPGSNILAKDIPAQLRGNGQASQDISQGGGVGNSYGFDSAHVIRQARTGWVPTWHVGASERAVNFTGGGRNAATDNASTYGPGGRLISIGPGQYSTPPSAYVAPPNPQTTLGASRPSGFAW